MPTDSPPSAAVEAAKQTLHLRKEIRELVRSRRLHRYSSFDPLLTKLKLVVAGRGDDWGVWVGTDLAREVAKLHAQA